MLSPPQLAGNSDEREPEGLRQRGESVGRNEFRYNGGEEHRRLWVVEVGAEPLPERSARAVFSWLFVVGLFGVGAGSGCDGRPYHSGAEVDLVGGAGDFNEDEGVPRPTAGLRDPVWRLRPIGVARWRCLLSC